MYWITADEHYGHKNILRYCNRPFKTIDEHDEMLIKNHNDLVGKDDITIHVGDFTLIKYRKTVFDEYISKLNGEHLFIKGSHDYWFAGVPIKDIYEKKIDNVYVVFCHYPMRMWSRSHYGSIQLYGHCHGKLPGIGRQMDVGVDCNNFKPFSFNEIKNTMEKIYMKTISS